MEKAKSKAERNLAKKTKFRETKAKDDFAAKLSVPSGYTAAVCRERRGGLADSAEVDPSNKCP